MIKYRTWYDTRIKEVEVIRETEKSVVFETGISAKRSSTDTDMNYFDTWQEAKDFLIEREKYHIRILSNQIRQRQEVLQKIIELRQ